MLHDGETVKQGHYRVLPHDWIDRKWILKDDASVPEALSPDDAQTLAGDRVYLVYLEVSFKGFRAIVCCIATHCASKKLRQLKSMSRWSLVPL